MANSSDVSQRVKDLAFQVSDFMHAQMLAYKPDPTKTDQQAFLEDVAVMIGALERVLTAQKTVAKEQGSDYLSVLP